MDTKGANPFLFTEDEYVSPNAGNSNPFLLTNDDFEEDISSNNDNPFLSQSATTIVSNNSTNPFAFDPTEFGPMEAQAPDVTNDQTTFMGNAFIDASAKNTTDDLFPSSSVEDFLTDNGTLTTAPQKPTDLDLKFTNTVTTNDNFASFGMAISTESEAQTMVQPRPPPSKETQDLLMSVMGAMDATSSHLLDRIPPTRTPSPVSMRDLHSPSPTPEPFGDLLDVSDSKSNIINSESPSNESEDLLMSLDQKNDINENPSVERVNKVPPQRPSPPARPPRPNLPPPKPSPPVFAESDTITKISNGDPPQKPPPPSFENKLQQLDQVSDIMDMLGTEEVQQTHKTLASTTDIMNLYNTPTVTKATDLLCDNVESTMDTTQSIINNSTVNDSLITTTFESADTNIDHTTCGTERYTSTPQPLIQDNFISPEPSQSDLQMDTSDSQSKGSVSSVTFNPFAVTEEASVSPVKQNEIFDNTENVFQEKSSTEIFELPHTTLSSVPHNMANIKQEDSFDAFTMKFESAAQDENKNGGTFLAFDSNNTVADTWGDNKASGFNESGAGFGPDESFDAFLAMQKVPTEMVDTANRFTKAGSMDSDEDRDFSVIIR